MGREGRKKINFDNQCTIAAVCRLSLRKERESVNRRKIMRYRIPLEDTWYRIQYIGYRTQDRVQDIGCTTQDTRYRIQYIGYKTQDTGYKI